jgi:hypothetical protein
MLTIVLNDHTSPQPQPSALKPKEMSLNGGGGVGRGGEGRGARIVYFLLLFFACVSPADKETE